MTQQDIAYYRARIEAERMAAERATHPAAARSHLRMVEEYAALLENVVQDPVGA